MFAPIPSAVISADAPHGLAVPASPVMTFFGTLPLHTEGYTVAMFERLVTFDWVWQIGQATLHEAVLHGRVWLIESETTIKEFKSCGPPFLRGSFWSIVIRSMQVFDTGPTSRICWPLPSSRRRRSVCSVSSFSRVKGTSLRSMIRPRAHSVGTLKFRLARIGFQNWLALERPMAVDLESRPHL